MKRFVSALFVAAIVLAALVGCRDKMSDETGKGERLSVVTTIFPEYDWVRQITSGNEDIEITALSDKGVDLHSFQPSVEDIVRISTCDMFICVGGESDGWVKDALKEATNKDMVVINLLEVLGEEAREEELKEGMAPEGDEGDEALGDEGPEYDEHVWLSLKNAETFCRHISKELIKLDEGNRQLYESNTEAYIKKLSDLDEEYRKVISGAGNRTLLFGDRFPFRYLVEDYGLDYYAAFVGCSAETEASFETVKFLADKLDELGLNIILKTESSDGKLADTVNEAAGDSPREILTLDSMQSVTPEEVRSGATYLSIMESNLNTLRKALE